MYRFRRCLGAALLGAGAILAASVVAPSFLAAQQPAAAAGDEGEALEIRVFDVGMLLPPVPDYPFGSTRIPTATLGEAQRLLPAGVGGGLGGVGGFDDGGAFGGGGFGGGGLGGGGGGGGFFAVPPMQFGDDSALGTGAVDPGFGSGGAGMDGFGASTRITMGDLVRVIVNTVEPESWQDLGGPGTIQVLGGSLIVRQTPGVLAQIEALLLRILEQSSQSVVTIRAHWIYVQQEDADSAAALAGLQTGGSGDGEPAGEQVDRSALLDELLSANAHDDGQITCFSGQTVSIVSGRGRSVVTAVVPVVGTGDAGYAVQPVIAHSGALLEVTPLALPGEESVVLDLRSIVTRWAAPAGDEAEVHSAEAVPAADRVHLVAQQLATTLRIPVGTPVLVGGLTFEPGAEDSATDLYLVVEVFVADEGS